MKLVRHPDDLGHVSNQGIAALGNFDGFHLGHQVIVGEAGRLARAKSLPLVVVTTEPHPRSFFSPQSSSFRLTPFRDRTRLFEHFGVDILVVLTFDESLSKTSAQKFVRQILAKKLKISHAVVGYDYRFGHKRLGDAALLAKIGGQEGMGVKIIEPISCHEEAAIDQIYSSTRVRDALREGRPRDAAGMLGHWWSISERVVEGDQRGIKLGFPTANMDIGEALAPRRGVYAVWVCIEERDGELLHPGVANFGSRPTFGEKKEVFEIHLLDFDEDLYGQHLRVDFVDFLRGEKTFGGVEELKAQISLDCKRAKEVLRMPQNKWSAFKAPTLDDYLSRFPDTLPKGADFCLDS